MIIVEPIKKNVSIHSPNERIDELNNLDEALVQAISENMSVMHEMKVDIHQLSRNAEQLTDPATLVKLQAMLADYSLNVEFASRVAQRTINAIDSLVRS